MYMHTIDEIKAMSMRLLRIDPGREPMLCRLGLHPSDVIGLAAANRAEETVAWHVVAQWNAVPAKTHIYPQITQIHADY